MGMDVHQAMTVVVVLDSEGRIVLQTMVPTDAASIIRLVQSLSGPLRVTFEETTQAAWLYEVIRAYVTEVVVCDPRRNKLLDEGSKTDKVDALKLAELLRTGCCDRSTTDMKRRGSWCVHTKRCRSILCGRWLESKRSIAGVASGRQGVESTSQNSENSGWRC